jgi:uncharacterized protein YegP (UPF0339 family)
MAKKTGLMVRKGNKGWYWLIIASNGRTLCHSETYTTKRAAKNGLAAVIRAVEQHK